MDPLIVKVDGRISPRCLKIKATRDKSAVTKPAQYQYQYGKKKEEMAAVSDGPKNRKTSKQQQTQKAQLKLGRFCSLNTK